MGYTTLSMRVNDTQKKKFDMICDDASFTSTAAITIFMKRYRMFAMKVKKFMNECSNLDF